MSKAYLLPNSTLDEKSSTIIQRIVELIEDPNQRESGLSFILNRIKVPLFSDILLKVKPQMYTQFLDSDDPAFFTNSLFIVHTLVAKPDFVHLFITHNPQILISIKQLLYSDDISIVIPAIDILFFFVVAITKEEVFTSFVEPLLTLANTFSEIRLVIVRVLSRILTSPKNQEVFIRCNGLQIIKQTLEVTIGDDCLGSIEVLIKLLKDDPSKYRDIVINSNILKCIKEIISTNSGNVLQRCIFVASKLSGSEFFGNECIDSGLFEECLDLLNYPFNDHSTKDNLATVLVIMYRVIQDRLAVQKSCSLKLTAKLRNLLSNILEFEENLQMIMLGMVKILVPIQSARRQLILTKVNQVLKIIPRDKLYSKSQQLLDICLKSFDETSTGADDIIYTQQDIERMAEYNSNKTKARQITEELIQTEGSYTKQLTTCSRVIYKALEPVLKNETKVIFSNIQEISKFQTPFYHALEKALLKAEQEKLDFVNISQVLFQFFSSKLQSLYTTYANTLDTAMSRLSELSKIDKDVECTIKELGARGEYVPSYLIQPIQRIPRYVLLLESLVKCLPEYLVECNEIKKCLTIIRNVATQINESKRHVDNMRSLSLWSKRIDLSPYPNSNREYFAETSQVLVNEKKNATVWIFVIFSDIAVLTRNIGKTTKEKWKIHTVFTLVEWKVLEVKNNVITFLQPTSNAMFEISCSTPKDTETLAESLRKAISNAKSMSLKKTYVFIDVIQRIIY